MAQVDLYTYRDMLICLACAKAKEIITEGRWPAEFYINEDSGKKCGVCGAAGPKLPTLAECKAKEAEFRAAQRAWILKLDAQYQEIEAKYSNVTPLRHPKGQTHERHTREYLWSDALFCQDRHPEAFEEFFECRFPVGAQDGTPLDKQEHPELEEIRQVYIWDYNIFDEEFRAAMPEDLHHVLEG